MLLFAIIGLLFYCMGGHSVPSECPKLSCKNTLSAMVQSINKSKISMWHTHAINVTDEKFVNCNLKIFKDDFKNQWKKENCSENINMNIYECQVYRGLECIPHTCRHVPSTACTVSQGLNMENFSRTLKGFIKTIQRMKNSTQ